VLLKILLQRSQQRASASTPPRSWLFKSYCKPSSNSSLTIETSAGASVPIHKPLQRNAALGVCINNLALAWWRKFPFRCLLGDYLRAQPDFSLFKSLKFGSKGRARTADPSIMRATFFPIHLFLLNYSGAPVAITAVLRRTVQD